MFCTHCGEQIEDNSRYCPYCGGEIPEKFRTGRPDRKQDPAIAEPVTAVSVQGSPALSRTSKPRKKTGLIPAVLLIAAAAAAGIWFFLNRSSRPVQNPESQAQAGEPAKPASDQDEWTVKYLDYELQSGNSRFIYEYDDYGNTIKETRYINVPPDTEITEDTEPWYILEYTYNKKQLLKFVHTDFKDGEPVGSRTTTYFYDSDGFLISEETTDTKIGESPETYSTTYINYVQGGEPASRPGNDIDTNNYYTHYRTYDTDGNLIQEDFYGEKSDPAKPRTRSVYEYDEEGRVIKSAGYKYDIKTNEFSVLTGETQTSYDEDGFVKTWIYQNYENPEQSTIYSYTREYDENGNPIKSICTEPDGSISTSKLKPYRIRKTKDK